MSQAERSPARWGQHFVTRFEALPSDAVVISDVVHNRNVTARELLTFTLLLQKQVAATGDGDKQDPSQVAYLEVEVPDVQPAASFDVVERPLVALIVNDGLLLSLSETACLLSGIPFLPLNPTDPITRLSAMTREFDAQVQLDEGSLQSMLDEATAASMSDPASAGPSWKDVVDTDVSDAYVAYIITTSGSTGKPKGVVAERRNLRAYVEGFAVTGERRRKMRWKRHRESDEEKKLKMEVINEEDSDDDDETLSRILEGRHGLCIDQMSRILLLSSCTFDPSIGDIACALHSGALLLCAPREAIQGNLWAVLCAANPTHVVSTPALWQTIDVAGSLSTCCDGEDLRALAIREGWPNASLACVALGGEPMPSSIIDDWASHVRLFNIYGVTEATIYQTLQRVFPRSSALALSVRRLLGGVDVPAGQPPIDGGVNVALTPLHVDDDDDDDGINASGGGNEMAVSRFEATLVGDQVCRGYYNLLTCKVNGDVKNNPFFILTTENSVPAPPRGYRTGDMAQLVSTTLILRDNMKHSVPLSSCIVPTLLCLGRIDFQVKINGQRVALEECESIIREAVASTFDLVCCTTVPRFHGGGGDEQQRYSDVVLCAMCRVRSSGLDTSVDDTAVGFSRPPPKLELWERVLEWRLESVLPFHMTPHCWALVYPSSVAETNTTTTTTTKAPSVVNDGILSRFPMSSNGKMDRVGVREYLRGLYTRTIQRGGGSECGATSIASWKQGLSPIGKHVVVSWEKLFCVPMKPKSDFFRLGGDSLGALKMVREVYLAMHNGSDVGIDAFGNMPAAFSPKHLTTHSTVECYISFLESQFILPEGATTLLQRQEDVTTTAGGEVADGVDAEEEEEEEGEVKPEEGRIAMDDTKPQEQQIVSVVDKSDAARHQQAGAAFLMEAVDSGDMPLVAVLLTAGGCKVNGFYERSVRSTTPLHVAVSYGDLRMVRLLVEYGAKITSVNTDGVTPAHLAAMQPQCDILRFFVRERGFPPLSRDARQQSLLHVAARFGSLACAEYLVCDCVIDPAIRDCWQRTAAHWAVLNGHIDVVRLLVSSKVKPEGCYKHQTRRGGKSTKDRSARLAKRRTHLVYESVSEMAARVHGTDSEYYALTKALVD